MEAAKETKFDTKVA